MPEEMNPEKDIADLLRELKPSRGTLSSDRLMYEAGRASVGTWLWKILALFSTLMAVTMVVALLSRPATVIERPVYIHVPKPEPVLPTPEPEAPPFMGLSAMPEVPQGSYLDHRNQMVRWGPEALPSVEHGGSMESNVMRPIDVYMRDNPDNN